MRAQAESTLCVWALGLGVWVSGFGMKGWGKGVSLGFWVEGLGFRVSESRVVDARWEGRYKAT